MNKKYARYKIFGGFGLILGLNVLTISITLLVVIVSDISYDKVDLRNDSDALMTYCVMIGMNLIFLLLLMTQCKFIITDHDGITTINPIIPILRSRRLWSDFDYYILIQEYAKNRTHEAVWLIQGEELKCRFSSFYYANYQELKQQIKTKQKIKGNFGYFEQLLIGLRLIKLRN